MRQLAVLLLAMVASWSFAPMVLAQSGAELALALRSNVVAIQATWPGRPPSGGFGFIVAEEDGTAYIATASHVLRGGPGTSQQPQVTVRFYDRPGQIFEAEIRDLTADVIDLGVITVSWPEDVSWRRQALAPTSPAFGDPVWFIGRERDWYVPAREGAFNRASAINRRIRIDDLPVRVGTSGAPLLSSDGIIGMIIRDRSADDAVAVPIAAIRVAFEEWGLPWQLGQHIGDEPAEAVADIDPAIEAEVPAPDPTETAAAAEAAFGLDRQDRALIQRALQDLGFDTGPADGILGSSSRAAIRDYQTGAGAVSTGYLTRAQAVALLDHGGRDLQPGDVFNDCDDEGWCPEMVVVPAGSFLMGSPEDEDGRYADEGPQHRVTIAEAFAIGVYEMTRGQFAAFVEATGHDAGDRCRTYEDGSWDWRDGKSWRSPGFAQSDEHPVVCVSWDDARAYVDWLNAEFGFEGLYRLPSEAEWEYAARGDTDSRRFWGDDLDDREGCAFANAADLTLKAELPDWPWSTMNCRDGHVYTAEVGSFAENDFGLHDPLGNVWEWVEDCWNDSYAGAPVDGSAWTSGDCGRRVLRGGSWFYFPTFLRSAVRLRFEPVYRFADLGFRVARTLR